MAPTKFQIFVDESIRNPTTLPDVNNPTNASEQQQQQQQQQQTINQIEPMIKKPLRYVPETLQPNQRYYFDERKIYPISGSEYSFEELNLLKWHKRQQDELLRRKLIELARENEELREKIEAQDYQIQLLLKQQMQSTISQPLSQPLHQQHSHHHPAQNRLSIVPQSLQPTHELYGANNELPSAVHDWDTSLVPDVTRNTLAHDISRNTLAIHEKFTLPIDQSQYIRENVPTSTPTSKRDDENRRPMFNNRRLSRPSMGGGSPTLKLSPITETSRECNSKSSSSSSATSSTPGTVKKVQPLVLEPIVDETDGPLDPNDTTTYRRLLCGLAEPVNRRVGYIRLNGNVPKIKQGACFQAGQDSYLIDKELCPESRTYTAQLLNDDSNDSADIQIKNICFRFDQPANEWLFYICNELHRRLVKQKTKPDIELSVMIANPAIIYNDASLLVDEYFRFVTLQHFIDACAALNKPFPKSVAAYITLELIQIIRQMHICDIIHMNINPNNVLITCCPTREDIANVDERTSIVKLIGFDRSMDTRLLPQGFKFELQLNDFLTCQMVDSKPWSYEIDWFGALNCIHRMFFLEDMSIVKDDNERWNIEKQTKGFPTNVWPALFDELLNINGLEAASVTVDKSIDELITWVKANISFVLKEADCLDRVLEEYCKATNKSIRT